MTTTDIPNDAPKTEYTQVRAGNNPASFELRIQENSSFATRAFKRLSRNYAMFHAISSAILFVELLIFLLCFSFLAGSSTLAYSIATLFLTAFSYLIIRYYLAARKPEQMVRLRNDYVSTCAQSIPFREGEPEYYLSLVHAIYRFTNHLHLAEYEFCPIPRKFTTASELASKLSYWLHWRDVHKIKEMFLFVAVRESIQLVKCEPTDLEAHAALAGAYRTLSKLYMAPEKRHGSDIGGWIPRIYASNEMRRKFERSAQLAIEEYRIIDHYSPGDPWVHEQLAAIYRDLEMPSEEIKEYETILEINPKDREILFRLGSLYFSGGSNAKGLQIYEKLKKSRDQKAELLLSLYHAYSSEEYDPDLF